MGNTISLLLLFDEDFFQDVNLLLGEEPELVLVLFNAISSMNVDMRKEGPQQLRLGLKRSPWRRLLQNNSEIEFKRYLGVTTDIFNKLCSIFNLHAREYHSKKYQRAPADKYDANAPNTYNNNRVFIEDKIGIVLIFMLSKCEIKYMSLIFGICRQRISREINADMSILVEALQNHPDAAVAWPTADEMDKLIARTNHKYPMLDRYNVWGAVDGCKIAIQTSTDSDLQAAYYNGWLHSHVVVNVLAVDTKGKFRFAILNTLGTTHDSAAALLGGLYHKIAATPNRNLTGDAAFAAVPGLIKLDDRNVIHLQHGQNLRQFRQISEWAMGIFQLPRLRCVLPLHNHELRQNILSFSVLFNNFKVSNGMKNEITTAFDA